MLILLLLRRTPRVRGRFLNPIREEREAGLVADHPGFKRLAREGGHSAIGQSVVVRSHTFGPNIRF